MKKALVIIILFSFFFILVYLFIKYSIKDDKEKSFGNEFRAIIISIKKTERNYDNLKLISGNKIINVTDRLRRSENYQIEIGDSLIKIKNTCTYYYKRKDKIIYRAEDACYTIFIP